MNARRVAIAAGSILAIGAVILTIDYAIARRRVPADDRLVIELQQKIHEDASFAPKLESEHKRITRDRDRRKARIRILSWVMIAAGAAFIWSVKRSLGSERPLPPKPVAEPARRRIQLTRPVPARHGPMDEVVDEIVARQGRSREAAIPILQAIQKHFRYLPDDALKRVCETTDITPAQIAGTSSFYSQFRRSPVGRHVVRVCHGTACHVAGARQITDELRRSLHIPEGADTDRDGLFTIDEVACLGCCSLAPVLMVDDQTVGKLTPAAAREALHVEHREPA